MSDGVASRGPVRQTPSERPQVPGCYPEGASSPMIVINWLPIGLLQSGCMHCKALARLGQ